MKHTSESILMIVVFIISVLLVIIGQRNVGYINLCMQVIGLVGILFVIGLYNKRYK
ncbi:MAG: hypothetical protein MR283_02570 [Erysipelotrichaceae bacterium]|nr:hypothetical protein [Erysipelotrichaceae bacterium]MDY6034672.1 hypothetical protein [Bulleidia sp.]